MRRGPAQQVEGGVRLENGLADRLETLATPLPVLKDRNGARFGASGPRFTLAEFQKANLGKGY